jgi:glycosyltransferase involved in cell wall biosynthesis
MRRPQPGAARFANLCAAHAGRAVPVRWMTLENHAALSEVGTLFVPGPGLAPFAWRRQRASPAAYSLCGVTHTIASEPAMDGLADLLLAPVAPWDAVICTSHAVLDSVRRLLEHNEAYLRERLDARRIIWPTLALIPLGVDCDALAPDGAQRAAWRTRLGIGPDDVVFLFMGRLSFHAKANPFPMYRGLEAAARRAQQRMHLVQAGWFGNDAIERAFREGAREVCPSVNAIFLDGRKPEVRAGVWHAADVFTSLSDNIQETFGLTPAEAMAAGLPSVVSDWNGYRDTVRHNEDGFRIPTLMPPAPAGQLLADRHAAGSDTYDLYIGRASLSVGVDVPAVAEAYARLAKDSALRRQMGEAARARARTQFDWSVIVRRYQALWAELGEKRRAGGPPMPATRQNPRRPDPFWLFGRYPTHTLGLADRVTATPGASLQRAVNARTRPLVAFGMEGLASESLTQSVLAALAQGEAKRVDDLLALGSPSDRTALLRTLAWLYKLDLVRIEPAPQVIPDAPGKPTDEGI